MLVPPVDSYSPQNSWGPCGEGKSAWEGNLFYETFYKYSPLPMGICLDYGDDMLNLDCNIAASNYYNRSVADIRGRTSKSMGAPDYCVKMWLECYRYAAQNKTSSCFVYSSDCVPRDTTMYFKCTILPCDLKQLETQLAPNDLNREKSFIYMINDVTALKKEEMKAKAIQKRLETILNNVSCVFWEVDVKSRQFTFVSQQSFAVLGKTPADWKSSDFQTFFQELAVPQFADSDVPTLEECLKGNIDRIMMIRANNIECYAKMTFAPSQDENENPTLIGTIQIVSHASNIASLSKQHEIQMKLQIKKQITNEITTEIRAPLNHLIGTLGMLRSDEKPSKSNSELIENAINCALSFQSSLDGVLDDVKFGIDQDFPGSEKNVEMNVRRIVEESVNTLSIKAEERGIDLVSSFPSNKPELYEGPGLVYVRQTVVHLLDLAIKCTKSGPVYLWLQETPDFQTCLSIAFPFNPDTFAMLKKAEAEPLDILLHKDGIGMNLLLCKMTTQALDITHENNAIHFKCIMNIKPHVDSMLPHAQHQAITSQKSIWISLENSSMINKPLYHQLHVWGVQVHMMVVDEMAYKLSRDEPGPDVIIIEEDEVSCFNNLSDLNLIVVSRYSIFKKRDENNEDRRVINLYRPINSSKLELALENAFKTVDGIELSSSPSSDDEISIEEDTPTPDAVHLRTMRTGRRPNVLVVDQSEISQKCLSIFLEQQEFNSMTTNDGEGLLKALNTYPVVQFDIILVDLSKTYRGLNPLAVIKQFRDNHPQVMRKTFLFGIVSGEEEIKNLDATITKPVRANKIRDSYDKLYWRRALMR